MMNAFGLLIIILQQHKKMLKLFRREQQVPPQFCGVLLNNLNRIGAAQVSDTTEAK
jgi:hypothetical protein